MDSTPDCKHTPPLAALISQEIEQAGGVITFERFMQLALYHPEFGYYHQVDNNIGKSGDFFTSISVGPLFGQMLAFWLTDQFREDESPVTIVEAGAHNGQLAFDILNFTPSIHYVIVEPIPHLEQKQRTLLAPFPNVKWLSKIDGLPPIHGAIISNELLDAFPIRVFRWRKDLGTWMERGVGIHNGEFCWKETETAESRLAELASVQDQLPDSLMVECSPAAERWWSEAALKLTKGVLLAIDYGGKDGLLANLTRPGGSLRAYRKHRLVENVLANPGDQDITASVDFRILEAIGVGSGLSSEPLQTQAQFLTRIAPKFFSSPPTSAQTRQFQTLTHPEHLGQAFKVLVQRR